MPSPSHSAPVRSSVLRFSVFELDVGAGELRKFGTRIRLQRQPLQVLTALLERPGQIVSREELRTLLWPAEVFVDFEHSLNSAVKKLRYALNDDSVTPRFIETIPRKGYRFVIPVVRGNAEPVKTEPITKADAADKHRPWRKPAPVFACVLLGIMVLALVVFRQRIWRHVVPGKALIESVAVLPLQNLSRDPDQEYFADGLTDALITDLGKLGTVRVISRTSVMRYKGIAKSLPAIARELGVDAVVEGTVLRSGDHVRITTQLVRADPEEHLWAGSYERDLSNVLLMQDELSRNIDGQIQKKVGKDETQGPDARGVDPQAYDLYLHGRYFVDKRLEDATRRAISYFEQAIEKDPTYAPAYSGLADCYTVSWAGAVIDQAKGEAYARKALSIQENLAEAHASLGINYLYQFDLRTAERELKRAIQLNPNYSMAHHWYALYLLAVGRVDEALAENRIAQQINPFSVPVNNARIIILTALRRYDDALAQANKLEEIEPSATSHGEKSGLYALKKMYGDAMAEAGKAAELSGNKQIQRDQDEIARAYAKAGYIAALRTAVQLKRANYPKVYNASDIAYNYLELGNRDEAMNWLQRAFNDHTFDTLQLKVAPELDPLRSDPRFQELVHRFESE